MIQDNPQNKETYTIIDSRSIENLQNLSLSSLTFYFEDSKLVDVLIKYDGG